LPDKKDPLMTGQAMGIFYSGSQLQLCDAFPQVAQNRLVPLMDGVAGAPDSFKFLGIFLFSLIKNDWGDVGKIRSWEGLAERFKLLDGQNIQLHPDPPYACLCRRGNLLENAFQTALFLDFFSVDEYVLNGKVKAASYEKPDILGPYGQVGRLSLL
jgi:hypothetical protein